jgi:haloacid dehalogenase superfamily, subfamily IA, variant 3 with third motif having DD or ED
MIINDNKFAAHKCVRMRDIRAEDARRLDQSPVADYICIRNAASPPARLFGPHSLLMSFKNQLLTEPVEAVVFDMDGTLIDSEAVFRSALFTTCAELGFEMTDEVHLAIVGGTAEHTKRVLFDAFGTSFPFEEFVERCTHHMEAELEQNPMRVKHGARDLLSFLNERGVPMAVATSSRQIHASKHLGRVGLLPFFRTLVTRDDVRNPKPHPEPYLTAAQRLNVHPSRCIAFEDSPFGVMAATSAGMRTFLVPDLTRPTEDIASRCAAVLENLAHALDHIAEMFEARV